MKSIKRKSNLVTRAVATLTTLLIVSLGLMIYGGYQFGVGPFSSLILNKMGIYAIAISDDPQAAAIAAATQASRNLKNSSLSSSQKTAIINAAASTGAKQSIQNNIQTVIQSGKAANFQDATTKVIQDTTNTTADSGKTATQQIAAAAQTVVNTQYVAEAIATQGGGGSATLTFTAGASCSGGNASVSIPAGKWASTGRPMGCDANGNNCNQRECVFCAGANPNGNTVGYAQENGKTITKACDEVFKQNPSSVVLPPEPGCEYTQGKPCAVSSGSTSFDSGAGANCYVGSSIFPSGSLSSDTKQVCTNGSWVDATSDNLNKLCSTGKLGATAIWDTKINQCVLPTPQAMDSSQLEKACTDNHGTWTGSICTQVPGNCPPSYTWNDAQKQCVPPPPPITAASCHTSHPGYLFVSGKCLPNTTANQALFAQANPCKAGVQTLSGRPVYVTCSSTGTPSFTFCDSNKFDSSGKCIALQAGIVNPNGKLTGGENTSNPKDCLYGPATQDRGQETSGKYTCNYQNGTPNPPLAPVPGAFNSSGVKKFSDPNAIVADPKQCQFPFQRNDGKWQCLADGSALQPGVSQNYLTIGATTSDARQCQNATPITGGQFRCDAPKQSQPFTGANAADAGSTNFDNAGSTVQLPGAPAVDQTIKITSAANQTLNVGDSCNGGSDCTTRCQGGTFTSYYQYGASSESHVCGTRSETSPTITKNDPNANISGDNTANQTLTAGKICDNSIFSSNTCDKCQTGMVSTVTKGNDSIMVCGDKSNIGSNFPDPKAVSDAVVSQKIWNSVSYGVGSGAVAGGVCLIPPLTPIAPLCAGVGLIAGTIGGYSGHVNANTLSIPTQPALILSK